MTNAHKIRIGLATIVAVALTALAIKSELDTVQKAQLLSEKGQTAVAEVTGASIKSKRRYGITTRSGEIDYSFTTADGQTISGSSSAPAELVDSLTDPDDDTILRSDAVIDILYLPENPGQHNAIKAELANHQQLNWLLPAVAFVVGGFVTFVVAGRIMRMAGADA